MRTVTGWIALVGSVGVGLALIITRLTGEVYSSTLYVRAGIVLPIVFLYGLGVVLASRRRRRSEDASG